MPRSWLPAIAISLTTGCTAEPRPPPPPVPTVTPETAVASPPLPEPPALAPNQDPISPGSLPIRFAQALVLGTPSPLARDQVTLIDPASRFLVEVQARLEDARLVLLDDQDAMVSVDGAIEVGTTTRFTLVPSEPLRPGTSYTLRLEGTIQHQARSVDGRAYLPTMLRLQTTGERTPQVPVKKPKRITKRH